MSNVGWCGSDLLPSILQFICAFAASVWQRLAALLCVDPLWLEYFETRHRASCVVDALGWDTIRTFPGALKIWPGTAFLHTHRHAESESQNSQRGCKWRERGTTWYSHLLLSWKQMPSIICNEGSMAHLCSGPLQTHKHIDKPLSVIYRGPSPIDKQCHRSGKNSWLKIHYLFEGFSPTPVLQPLRSEGTVILYNMKVVTNQLISHLINQFFLYIVLYNQPTKVLHIGWKINKV